MYQLVYSAVFIKTHARWLKKFYFVYSPTLGWILTFIFLFVPLEVVYRTDKVVIKFFL